MLKRFGFSLLTLCLSHSIMAAELMAQTTAPAAIDSHYSQHNYETRLLAAIDLISRNEIDEAIQRLQMLTQEKPDFRLAQLIYGDLLMARSRPIKDFGNHYTASYEQIQALRQEALKRLQHKHQRHPAGMIPANLIELSRQQKHVIVVDMQAARLFLFRNRKGMPELLDDFYISIGKKGFEKYFEGDQRTPTGVYFVTSYIEPERLSDLYGAGAFPINYPNLWDQRNSRTGSGIWLHGTPTDTYSRPPQDSNGCVVLTNQDFERIAPYIDVENTPVILADAIEWLPPHEWKEQQNNYRILLEQWRKDWESRDAGKYLSHYSREFQGLGNNYQSWVNYKKRVNPSKRYIKVRIEDTSIFRYPGQQDMLVFTFKQDYRSDNFRRQFQKRQYWIKEEDGQWRILYEENVS